MADPTGSGLRRQTEPATSNGSRQELLVPSSGWVVDHEGDAGSGGGGNTVRSTGGFRRWSGLRAGTADALLLLKVSREGDGRSLTTNGPGVKLRACSGPRRATSQAGSMSLRCALRASRFLARLPSNFRNFLARSTLFGQAITFAHGTTSRLPS